MKKVLLLLMAILIGSGFLSAQETVAYTLQFGSDYNSKKISSYTDTWSVTVDNFKWTIENFNNNNNGWNYVKCGSKNFTSVAKITTSSAIKESISKVVITIDAITVSKVNSIQLKTSSSNNFTTPIETVSCSPAKGAITFAITQPQANLYYQLVFDCQKGSSNGLIQLSKVEYYTNEEITPVDPDALAAPVITESWDKVTISAKEGATIYYTTHESWDETEHADPTTESAVYTEPIEFYGPVSYKAIAVKDGKTSAVASYDVNTFVFEDLSSLSMITEDWNTYKFVFKCPLTVLYQDAAKKNLYVSNGFSNMLIYGGDQAAYTPGDVINGVCATVYYHSGLQEFLPTAFGEVSAAAGTVRQPVEISYENVAENYMHQYVTLPGVTISSINDKSIIVADADGNTVTVYNKFGITNPTVGAKCDVTGFVGVFNSSYQIFPTEFTSYTGAISLGEAYSYDEYSNANVLTFAATISKNGNPIDDASNYEVLLDGVSLGHAGEAISHFAYNKDGKFSLKNGDRTIALDVEWPNLDIAPKIAKVKYIKSEDGIYDAIYYIEPATVPAGYNWLVNVNTDGAIFGWDNEGAACKFENVGADAADAPAAINANIAFPFAVSKATRAGEYDIVVYSAEAADLATNEIEAPNDNNTSGVADVAVDQNAAAEYYNLQGVRVNGDLTPGLYIRRQGNQATKVVVR